MASASASVVIAHSADVVWQYITDPDNTSHVLPGTLSTHADKRPPYEVGDRWYGRAKFFGMTYEWIGVFTRVEVDRLMEFRSVESRFPFITTDTLDAVPRRYALHLPCCGRADGPRSCRPIARHRDVQGVPACAAATPVETAGPHRCVGIARSLTLEVGRHV